MNENLIIVLLYRKAKNQMVDFVNTELNIVNDLLH